MCLTKSLKEDKKKCFLLDLDTDTKSAKLIKEKKSIDTCIARQKKLLTNRKGLFTHKNNKFKTAMPDKPVLIM